MNKLMTGAEIAAALEKEVDDQPLMDVVLVDTFKNRVIRVLFKNQRLRLAEGLARQHPVEFENDGHVQIPIESAQVVKPDTFVPGMKFWK